jgi:hypothetical protein
MTMLGERTMNSICAILLALLLCSCATTAPHKAHLSAPQKSDDRSSIFIIGPVQKPGRYHLQKGRTLRGVIDLAGGCEWWADSVRLRRGCEVIYERRPGLHKCQEYDYGDAPDLQSGDLIEFTLHYD